jgi:catechol 2,3-dioxygenase-like lactoylglutathione lyase family enzyme
MKFAHLGIGVRDLKTSAAFYKKVFAAIGLPLIDESESAVRFGQNRAALFYIHTRQPAPGPIHVAFEVETREMVDAFHRIALAAGGKDHGPPGVRPHYSPTYYAAFVIEPDGHNLEAVRR